MNNEKEIVLRVATKTGNPGKNSKPFNAESLKARLKERKMLNLK